MDSAAQQAPQTKAFLITPRRRLKIASAGIGWIRKSLIRDTL
jgi:hypothetical protein